MGSRQTDSQNNTNQESEFTSSEIEELERYIRRHYREKQQSHNKFSTAGIPIFAVANVAHFSTFRNRLDGMMKKTNDNTFVPYLTKQLNENKSTINELLCETHLPLSVMAKMENNEPWRPDKDTVIKIGMAMQMDQKNMDKLLAVAGYVLTDNDKKDIIIKFCIKHKKYRAVTINRVIFKYTNEHFYEKLGIRK